MHTLDIDDPHIDLLGKTPLQVFDTLGDPFGRYDHRGREILMFAHNSDTVTCEIEANTVVRVNTHEERRTAVRIKPPRIKRAFLRHGDVRCESTVVDMSIKSIAVKVVSGPLPQKGEFVTCCTSLMTSIKTKTYVVVAGHVHHVDEDRKKVVILLHMPFDTHSHKALHNYIHAHQALSSLGKAKKVIDAIDQDRNIEVIKSDLCLICAEGACGGSHNAYKEKKQPRHKGIH